MYREHQTVVDKLKANNPDFRKLAERFEALEAKLKLAEQHPEKTPEIDLVNKEYQVLKNEIMTILKKII